MKLTIRQAIEKDAPDLLLLIKELALFERAPEKVINTEEWIKRDGFGKAAPIPSFCGRMAVRDRGYGHHLFPVFNLEGQMPLSGRSDRTRRSARKGHW